MNFERLIAEHDHIDALTVKLEAIAGRDEPDAYAVSQAQFDLRDALDAHFAHEDGAMYARLIDVSGEAGAAVQTFHADFAALCVDWNAYLAEWTADCLEADWESFRAETASLMQRVRDRTKQETNLIYGLALRHNVISLRDLALPTLQ